MLHTTNFETKIGCGNLSRSWSPNVVTFVHGESLRLGPICGTLGGHLVQSAHHQC